MNALRLVCCAAILSLASLSVVAGPTTVPASIKTEPTADAAYEKTISERTAKIVDALGLTDEAKKSLVHAIIQTQYRTLNAWHEGHDARRAELRKIVGKNTDPTPEKAELDAINASLKEIHDYYLASLAEHLTAEQVDTVKDKMVYGKVQVTYNGYLAQNPTLREEDKKVILDLLLQAREEGMDGGSTEEKNKIFDIWKGRINNYLSKNGYGKKKPTTNPSTPPAK